MSNKTMLMPVVHGSDTMTSAAPPVQSYNNFQNNAELFTAQTNKTYEKNYANIGNTLLANASGLFKQILLLQNSYEIGSVDSVRQSFVDSINQYTEVTAHGGVVNSQVMLARYLLCTFLDEMISATFWGKDNNWSSNSLLGHFYNETYGGEKFFQLLDKLMSSPSQYVDLLEVMYVCLSLGFEGKYRIQNRGKMQLDTVRDGLYRQIKIIQGREPQNFYAEQAPSTQNNHLFKKTSYRVISMGVLAALGLVYGVLTFALVTKENKTLLFLESKQEKYLQQNPPRMAVALQENTKTLKANNE